MIIDALRDWAYETKLQTLPQSPLGKAIDYMLSPWPGLTVFLTDPRVPLDNSAAERALRGVVVGPQNHYGSHSKRGVEVEALFHTLFESAKLVGVDPTPTSSRPPAARSPRPAPPRSPKTRPDRIRRRSSAMQPRHTPGVKRRLTEVVPTWTTSWVLVHPPQVKTGLGEDLRREVYSDKVTASSVGCLPECALMHHERLLGQTMSKPMAQRDEGKYDGQCANRFS